MTNGRKTIFNQISSFSLIKLLYFVPHSIASIISNICYRYSEMCGFTIKIDIIREYEN